MRNGYIILFIFLEFLEIFPNLFKHLNIKSPMAKELYVARHGQSTYNLEGLIQGWSEKSVLTDLGKQQAYSLGDKLKAIKFDRIISSDLQRAKETTEIILDCIFKHYKTLPFVEYNSDLRERDTGELNDQYAAEVKVDFTDRLCYGLDKVRSGDGVFYKLEPLLEVKARTKRIKKNIVNSRDSRILIIAHEWINSYFFNELLNEGIGEETFHEQTNCSVSYFRLSSKGKVLEYFINSFPHNCNTSQ